MILNELEYTQHIIPRPERFQKIEAIQALYDFENHYLPDNESYLPLFSSFVELGNLLRDKEVLNLLGCNEKFPGYLKNIFLGSLQQIRQKNPQSFLQPYYELKWMRKIPLLPSAEQVGKLFDYVSLELKIR